MGIRARSSRYFASALASAAISLLTLPLTTRILGPRDYGLFALGVALASGGVGLAAAGTGFVIANRWQPASRPERRSLVSSVVLMGTAVTACWAGAVGTAYAVLHDDVAVLAEIPASGLILLLIATAVAVPAQIAFEVLTIEGRAGVFAATSIVQAAVTATATLVALFGFDLGNRSLFVGAFAGTLVSLVVSLAVLRDYLAPRYDSRWWSALAVRSFFPAQATDAAQLLLEKVLLSRFAGFHELGLYTHAQRYYGLAHASTKAVARGVWPVTLEEARDLSGTFPATRRTWNAIHVALTAAGIALTMLGEYVISALTNDKFTGAAVYLAPWFAFLILQQSAKPEVGTAYALASGRTVARVALGASLVGLVAMAVLIPPFGAAGALAALLVQALAYRIAVRVPARRLRGIPFLDVWAVLGVGMLGAAFALKHVVADGALESVLLCVALELLWFVVAARVIGETWRSLPLPRVGRGSPSADATK